uniref:Uncharacterized protein n=1 Tax=Candidatus Kentrum sp. LPFa TaxID=2126335 RepID=A0A450XPL1_9GAMM|nr:MAG: hypothetical protein BECKLPF1236C_GA0070990_101306 [Candidatus Kentron sp. LPFa]
MHSGFFEYPAKSGFLYREIAFPHYRRHLDKELPLEAQRKKQRLFRYLENFRQNDQKI